MLEMLVSLFYFVILLGICVLVHEWGHFIVAKRCGVRVERFSIGFGKPFFTWVSNGTEFCLAPIPLGGYVKMAGDNPEEANPDHPWEFFSAAIWRRMLIVLAGPAMNIVTAFAIFFLITLMYGEPYADPIVGHVAEKSAAEKAGLTTGDLILEVDGRPIRDDADLLAALRVNPGPTSTFVVEHNGAPVTRTLDWNNFYPSGPFVVPDVRPDPPGPAEDAGIGAGDMLLAVNGEEILSVSGMAEALRTQVRDGAPVPFRLTWRTPNGDIHDATLVPDLVETAEGLVSQIGVLLPDYNTDDLSGFANPDPNSRDHGAVELLQLGFSLQSEPIVGKTFHFSPARRIGLSRGDRILSIDGVPIETSIGLQRIVYEKVDVLPGGEMVPRKVEVRWLDAGTGEVQTAHTEVKLEKLPKSMSEKEYVKIGTLGIDFWHPVRRFGVIESIGIAGERSWGAVLMMRDVFSGLINRTVSYRHLAGPVGIVGLAGQFSRRGLDMFFYLIAILNVNLAIINLFPIPILDGGHVLLFGIEKVKRTFTNKGLSVGQLVFAQKIGVFILLPLMLFVFWNDFARLDFFQRLGSMVSGLWGAQ